MSDNRAMGYQEDGKWFYRASGFGGCIKKVVASATGYEEHRGTFQKDIMDTAAAEGNLHEPAVIQALIDAHGYKIADAGQDEVELRLFGKVHLRGHIDGIGRPPRARKDRLIEVKTMSRDRFKKWTSYGNTKAALLSGEFNSYAWQVSAYMAATGLECIYVVKDRNSGKLDIGELKTPLYSLDDIKRRVREIHRYVIRDELPSCTGDGGEKFFCPFPTLHDEWAQEDDDVYAPVESINDAVLAGLAEEHARLGKIIAQGRAADDERKDITSKIRTMVHGGEPKDDDEAREVVAGGYKIVDAPRAKNKQLDVEMLGKLMEERWGIAWKDQDMTALRVLVEEATVSPGMYRVLRVKEEKR